VKRFIGKRFDDALAKEDARRVPYDVVAAKAATRGGGGGGGGGGGSDAAAAGGGDVVGLRCPALGPDAVLTPEEVSSRVLRRLLDSAEAFAGGAKITRAVITVPAYFDDAQCDATIAAGELAGLEKVKLLREPIAAALAYGVGAFPSQTSSHTTALARWTPILKDFARRISSRARRRSSAHVLDPPIKICHH
jgi:molecular chaperone DnaK